MRAALPFAAATLAFVAAGPAVSPANAQGIDIVFPGGRVRIGGGDERPAESPPVDGLSEEPLPLPGDDPHAPPAGTSPYPTPAPALPPIPAPADPPLAGGLTEVDARRAQIFTELLENATLAGRHTTGEDGTPRTERYDIAGVSLLDLDRGLWQIDSRIRYGEKQFTLPVIVTVRWAGDSPVIVLEPTAFPGLGTFSAEVLLTGDRAAGTARYAGVWTHDDVGGHLFGRITGGDDSAE